jgi:hypothetical protein
VAARRLIAVMLVLLFLSSLAAALAPVEQRRDESSSTSTSTTTTAEADTRGALVRKTLDARRKRTPSVRARVGDQLQLLVKSDDVAIVELPAFGLTDDVDPVAPARFDLLLDREGDFQVRELGGRKLGTVEVSRPARKGSARDQAPARS